MRILFITEQFTNIDNITVTLTIDKKIKGYLITIWNNTEAIIAFDIRKLVVRIINTADTNEYYTILIQKYGYTVGIEKIVKTYIQNVINSVQMAFNYYE